MVHCLFQVASVMPASYFIMKNGVTLENISIDLQNYCSIRVQIKLKMSSIAVAHLTAPAITKRNTVNKRKSHK